MTWKIILVFLVVLLLLGAVVAEAKSSGKGRSSGTSKSFSSKASSSDAKSTAGMVGIASVPVLVKSTKNKAHLDDDLFENETQNETVEQAPNTGVLPVYLVVGALLLAWQRQRC